MRMIAGIIAGLVTAFACIVAVELVGHTLFPVPPGTNLHDPADMQRLASIMPFGALVMVIAGWFAGTLAGAAVANGVARGPLAGWTVALLIVCAGVWTMLEIPHPLWMWAAGILLPLLAAWIAQRFVKAPA